MIFVSSHKPFAESPEYAENQARAARSWQHQPCVSGIYYLGSYEERLVSEKTLFVRKDDAWPRLKSMTEFAARIQVDYVAIINADIVIRDGIEVVEKRMRAMSLPAATSYRYEFNPEDYPNLDAAMRHKEDRGMDIFIANPKIWAMVAKAIPDYLRFGHPTWDTWVCGFFCEHLGYGFRHFTDDRCIFHPKHNGRLTPHSAEIRNDEKYFTLAKRPSPL